MVGGSRFISDFKTAIGSKPPPTLDLLCLDICSVLERGRIGEAGLDLMIK